MTREEVLIDALKAACGYLLNAKIDIETGTKKATTLATLEGGVKCVDDVLKVAAFADADRREANNERD